MTSGNAPTVSPSDAARVAFADWLNENWSDVSLADQMMMRDAFVGGYKAALAAMPPAGAYVLVPKDPTEAMLLAGANRQDDFFSEKGVYPRTKAVYRAMIAAAPAMSQAGDAPDLELVKQQIIARFKYCCVRATDPMRLVPQWEREFAEELDTALLSHIATLNAVIADQAALAEKRRDEIEALKAGNTSAAKSSMSASTGEVAEIEARAQDWVTANVDYRKRRGGVTEVTLNATYQAFHNALVVALRTRSSAVEECASFATPSAEQKVAIYDEADAAMKAYENWLDETGREGSDDLRDAFLWGRASRAALASSDR